MRGVLNCRNSVLSVVGLFVYYGNVMVAWQFLNTKMFLFMAITLPTGFALLFVWGAYRLTATDHQHILFPEWLLLVGLWTIGPYISTFFRGFKCGFAESANLIRIIQSGMRLYPLPVITIAGYDGSLLALLILTVALPVYGHFCRRRIWDANVKPTTI